MLEHEYDDNFSSRFEAIFPKEKLIVPVPSGGEATPQITEPGAFTRSVPEMKDPVD